MPNTVNSKMKKDYHVLMLSDQDQERLNNIANEAICVIQQAKNTEEQAYVLRVLMESFEETHNCTVPFKGRYTEPAWNYDKGANE